MPSSSYLRLQARLATLKSRFLNFSVPLDRNTSEAELDSMACFKLLMHAEIEFFIEERVAFAINQTMDEWTAKKTINRCGFQMLLRWQDEIAAMGLSSTTAPTANDLNSILNLLKGKALSEIKDNHGIKQDAFKRLAAIAGMSADEHYQLLLTSLDLYGKGRGDVAHQPPGRVRSLSGPADEELAAVQLLELLTEFDDYIELFASLAPPVATPFP